MDNIYQHIRFLMRRKTCKHHLCQSPVYQSNANGVENAWPTERDAVLGRLALSSIRYVTEAACGNVTSSFSIGQN